MSERQHQSSVAAAVLLMWIGWAGAVLVAVLCAVYLPVATRPTTSVTNHFGIFPAGLLLFSLMVGGGLRFWLSRIRSYWLKLIPYFIGLFFAYQAGLYGTFLIPEFFTVFRILSAVLYLLYFPLFVRLPRSGPPPLPGGQA